MGADLVGASGFQPTCKQRSSGKTPQHLPVGDGPTPAFNDRHVFAACRMPTERRVHCALLRVRFSPDKRLILSLH